MTNFLNPPDVHTPTGYSHTALVPGGTELVFFAGQVGVRPDGSIPSTLEEQSEQMFNNIAALLRAHGLAVSSIVKFTQFIVTGQDIQTVRTARAKLLGEHRPTSTLIFVPQLANPQFLVECEAIAARTVG
jgi:enamine deaminase RidA (YjgF/YER057c/UK114 family)